jgi:hypothetical protein
MLTLVVQVRRPCGDPDHDSLSDEEYADAIAWRVECAIAPHGDPEMGITSIFTKQEGRTTVRIHHVNPVDKEQSCP